MAKRTPLWGKEVLKDMIDLDLKMPDIANGIGKSREYVSLVVHGTVINEKMKEDILHFINAQKEMNNHAV